MNRKHFSMKKRSFIFGLILILGLVSLSRGAVFKGWCVKILDGDTVVVYVNKKMLKIRLAYIDCPESDQPFGPESIQFVTSLKLKKKVQVENESYAEDGLLIGRVIINNQDLSMILVEAGLAWYYKDHGAERYLAKAQRKAKRNKIGLWIQKKPVAPWIYREHKQKQ